MKSIRVLPILAISFGLSMSAFAANAPAQGQGVKVTHEQIFPTPNTGHTTPTPPRPKLVPRPPR